MISREAVVVVRLLIVFAKRKVIEKEFMDTSHVFALRPFWFIQALHPTPSSLLF